MIVSIPFLLIGPYRRWLFGTMPPVERRRGFVHTSHLDQGWIVAEGDRCTVTVRLTTGAQVHYTAHGQSGRSLAERFAALLGPRLLQAAR